MKWRPALRRRAVGADVVAALVDLPATDEAMARNQLAIAPIAFHRDNVPLAQRVLGKTLWNAAANVRSRQLGADYNVVPRLGDIGAPSLILTGREDFFCPPKQAERLHRGIPHSELVIFECSGHYPFAEENAAFQDAVRAWLSATQGGEASPERSPGSPSAQPSVTTRSSR